MEIKKEVMVINNNVIFADDDQSESPGPRVRFDAEYQIDAGSWALPVQLPFR